ncbi:MAG: ATP-binding protein [Bacteroidota bacterium]|nr:ATP-binding protein [Bacteroidota bacterium]
MQEISKVVAIGPESTGKSTLCSCLAAHFDAVWCPEYAREYLLKHGTNYTFDDLLKIAKGQVALEEAYAAKAVEHWQRNGRKTPKPFLFADTDMYVMKVWCEYVFGKCHQFILDKIVESSCDLYLLCNIDLPWIKDKLREYPDLQSREELYHIYKDILVNQSVPWVEVKGTSHERIEGAIKWIRELVAP